MKNIQLILFATLLSFFFSIATLKAEDKFRSGYIITNSNDTVRGYLQQYSINVHTRCLFKKSMDDKTTEYLPGEIIAYRYEDDGKFFMSKEAPLESGKKMLFLQYLIKGKANMYFMRDATDHYFIETDNNKILELSEEPKIVLRGNASPYYKQGAYKGKLKYVLSDCPQIFAKIDNSFLTPSNMINIAKDYHNIVCNSEQCIIYEQKVNRVKVRTSIVGGVAFNKFEFGKNYTNYNPEIFIGCKFDFENLFFTNEHSAVQLGLILQKHSEYSVYSVVQSYDYKDKIDTSKSNLNTISLRIPIVYKYTFSHGKIRPYLGVGLTSVFVISKSTDFSIADSWVADKKPFPFYQAGAIGLVGAKYMLNNKHALNFELSYEYAQGLSSVDHLSTLKNTNISFVLGYTL